MRSHNARAHERRDGLPRVGAGDRPDVSYEEPYRERCQVDLPHADRRRACGACGCISAALERPGAASTTVCYLAVDVRVDAPRGGGVDGAVGKEDEEYAERRDERHLREAM